MCDRGNFIIMAYVVEKINNFCVKNNNNNKKQKQNKKKI